MKLLNQTNKILGKDWLQYHPYDNITFADNYYTTMCNSVLKIIQRSEIRAFIVTSKGEKSLACMLVAYFEDVISETRLFSTFTHLHKKMYGKELPFYKISDDYYNDEINLQDIYFLIWYHISIHEEDTIIDPYFNNNQAFKEAVSEIFDLFDREFEKAPQNENLQNFLRLPAKSDVKTVREKLSFIAHKSFLWKAYFDKYFNEIIEEYKENNVIVLNEETEVKIYDQRIHFIFNEYLPLLSLRSNEYFAEILRKKHSEYQFIKNISKRIAGCFLIRKIESHGFLIEHLTSKKQLWLSNEFTSFHGIKLHENKTVLTLGLVNWKDNVWQNQGGCIVNTLEDMKGIDVSEHLFDDENKKMEIIHELETAFLELSNGKRIVYLCGKHNYAAFNINIAKKRTKNLCPNSTDQEIDEQYKDLAEKMEKNLPPEWDEPIGIFFNPNSGQEVYYNGVISCMPDKDNPYYDKEEFDLCDLITNNTFSEAFINYVIENKIMDFSIPDYENPNLFAIMLENLDFLLRFYRRSRYFAKREEGEV